MKNPETRMEHANMNNHDNTMEHATLKEHETTRLRTDSSLLIQQMLHAGGKQCGTGHGQDYRIFPSVKYDANHSIFEG